MVQGRAKEMRKKDGRNVFFGGLSLKGFKLWQVNYNKERH